LPKAGEILNMTSATLFDTETFEISTDESLAKMQSEIAAIEADPAFVEFKKTKGKVAKLEKKLVTLQKKKSDLEREHRWANRPNAELPEQVDPVEVFQVHVSESYRHYGMKKDAVREEDYLVLRLFGRVLRIEDFSIFQMLTRYGRNDPNQSFQDFLGLDEDTLSCEITKIENLGELPDFLNHEIETEAARPSHPFVDGDDEEADDDE
jgi:hypothetical protein